MPNFDVSRIAGNMGALNALNSLSNINKQLSVHQARLASGKRINTAEDDPAGLTIATKLQARSEGLKVALSNIGDAKNLLAVSESGLGRINDILVQMRNKAEAGASDTLGSSERAALVEQMKAYAEQIDDIVTQTKWNGKQLLNGLGDFGGKISFQTGADEGDTTSLSGLSDLKTNGATLAIAAKAATSTAAVASDTAYNVLSDTGTDIVGGKALNPNLSELSSGTYTVEVTYGGTLGDSSSIRLKDSSGTYLMIDTQQAGDAVDTKTLATLDLSGAGQSAAIDFGNGLEVKVNKLTTAGPTANGTYTGTVTYTKSGTYTLKNGATTIDQNATASQFASYMTKINDGLTAVSTQLSQIGALNGRLTFKEDQVSAAQINVEGAYNRIMNANMAEEQVNASKFQILQQTSAAMLAQANAAPQFLLSLFR